MSYIFLSQTVNELAENIERKYNIVNYGFAEDLFFGYLTREANLTFYVIELFIINLFLKFLIILTILITFL